LLHRWIRAVQISAVFRIAAAGASAALAGSRRHLPAARNRIEYLLFAVRAGADERSALNIAGVPASTWSGVNPVCCDVGATELSVRRSFRIDLDLANRAAPSRKTGAAGRMKATRLAVCAACVARGRSRSVRASLRKRCGVLRASRALPVRLFSDRSARRFLEAMTSSRADRVGESKEKRPSADRADRSARSRGVAVHCDLRAGAMERA